MSKKGKILVVDDTKFYLTIIADTLEKEGYEVFPFDSGGAGLEFLLNNRVDLILLDITMPNMSGFDVCKKLKENEDLKKIPIIFISSNSEVNERIEGIKLGAVDYITKPFHKEELLVRVNTHIDLEMMRQSLEKQAQDLIKINQELNKEIDERKKAEEKIKAYANELEELVATKDKFFSIIAHDLRNPIHKLLGVTQILSKDIESLNYEQIKKFSIGINNNIKNIHSLLENLLTWSLLQRNKLEYQPILLNLHSEVQKIISLFEYISASKNIQINYDIKKNIFVTADSNMLNTILRNLISNALKFTKPGGEINIAADISDDFVIVQVKDTGVGMQPEDIENLFKLKTKPTSYGTAGEKGTGLGLTLVSDMVKINRGKIWVESTPNVGTTFYFTLPLL